MQPTIQSGRQLAAHVNIAGSQFRDVDLADAEFDNVNLSRAKLHNINLSDIAVSAVQIGGASFKHVGLPPCAAGRQRPLRFEDCDLNGSTFTRCNLSNVVFAGCDVSGMTIDGVAVADMLKVYQARQPTG
jgi:uncharacterized protein YjbI with pentapeptide repeats